MFPSSEFGGQELKTDSEITKFCEGKGLPSEAPGCYLMAKTTVKGSNCHPVFQLAKSAFPGEIRWNFDGVFMFDREGAPVLRTSIQRPPTEEQIEPLL